MCGIAGFISQHGDSEEGLRSVSTAMITALSHRGPDDHGVWVDANTGVALAHSRLSIIDLSILGHQPMASSSGRYMLTYNGEIYNFQALKQELEHSGSVFQGHSDTEVLLAAIEQWGIEQALVKAEGMFAFALWDRKERALFLARDRLGEKPLYYGRQGRVFIFASELKAFRRHPEFQGEINRGALTLYMRHNCIGAPYSIYKGINKLIPGTYLRISLSHCLEETCAPVPYWSLKDVAENRGGHIALEDNEAVDALDKLLRRTIRNKMVSDVPLGAFLSGGVDSSTIVSLMQAESNRKIKTFSIGFYEDSYNEAQHAKAIASHLGTDHTELYVTSDEAMAVIPKLADIYDEPFSDSSQIPTYLVSQMTRQHVTVALSGDGGDELFGGYNRYFNGKRLWDRVGWMPPKFRHMLSGIMTLPSPQRWDKLFGVINALLPSSMRHGAAGDKIHKLAGVVDVSGPEEMYRRLVTHWQNADQVVLHAFDPSTLLNNREAWPNLHDFTEHMMYLDAMTYLPDDILAKVDRATMAVSLESRVPFLDHNIVEFAWQLPLQMKIRNGQGKWILKQVLNRYVPKNLIDRPKMGFGAPIDSWLRGPLRDWAESLLSEKRIREEGIFDPLPIREKWEQHLSGKKNWQYLLWDVLMFQAWNERW